MIRLQRLLAPTALACALLSTPALAQRHDGSIGYGGGWITFTDFNSGGGAPSLALDPGWVATGHIEHWVNRGRLGGRVNVGFSRRPLETVGDSRAIHTWLVGGDLLLRLLSPQEGRGFAPFLAGGGGLVMYGLGEGPPVIVGTDVRYPGDSDRQLSVSGGLGFDIIPSMTIFRTPAAFRIEVLDHMTLESPFERVDGSTFDPVHNIRVTFSILGLVRLVP